MAEHNDTGMQGEALARRHLEEQGFAIMETNWRRGKYEVDIIAYREGLIVFAEVKTRNSTDYGNPEEFVDRKKQKAYIRLADAYVTKHRREEEVHVRQVRLGEILALSLHLGNRDVGELLLQRLDGRRERLHGIIR